MSRRPERLADLLPGVVADLAARHNTTNGAPAMPFAPDHGSYTDDLDAMTMDELLRLQRLLSHQEPELDLQAAVGEELQYRKQLRDELTGGAA